MIYGLKASSMWYTKEEIQYDNLKKCICTYYCAPEFLDSFKKVLFFSGQALTNHPSPLLVAGPLEKELFCGFPKALVSPRQYP